MLITPVDWYQMSSPLKLLIDLLVCVDRGNPIHTYALQDAKSRKR